MNNKINYKLSDDTWDSKENIAINKVIDSKMFTMGRNVKKYEDVFASKFGSKHAIMVNSGSSANLLAIAALVYSNKLQRGDEVIVTAVSWSTTYAPLQQYGLKVKFVDIDKNTLNISVNELEKAITNKTKMILLVNLLGNPNEFDKIYNIKKDIIIMEDNCESLGAKYHNKYAGTIGLLGTFSTFYSHHLCTMEGGVVVTNDDSLYDYMLCIRAHGWTRNLGKDNTIYKKGDDDFYESFNFIMPGYNLRPLEIEAAIGIEQLEKMDIIIQNRRDNAKYFVEKMKPYENIRLQTEVEASSWFGFAMVLQGELVGKRSEIVNALKNANIEVRPIVAGNFTKNKAIEYMDYEIFNKLTNANEIHDNGFFIGNHSVNNNKEVVYFISILNSVIGDKKQHE